MFYESYSLLRNKAAVQCADESGEELGTGHKLVAVLLSLVITGVTMFGVAMPFALLHLR